MSDGSRELPARPPAAKTRSTHRKAKSRAAVNARVVHEAIQLEGREELERPTAALAWSALAAGMSMGFSLVAEGLLHEALPAAPWRPLVAKVGYAFGFLFVVLGRQQLFTENTLTVVLPVMEDRDARALAHLCRVWAVVLVANVVGAALFAFSLDVPGVFSPARQQAFTELARKALEPAFGGILLRGIYGGWLIALMVWLLPAARNVGFFVVGAVAWLVGAGEFSHSVAGSVDALFLVARGEVSVLGYLGGFLVPAVLGNTIGGVALVAAVNHAAAFAGWER